MSERVLFLGSAAGLSESKCVLMPAFVTVAFATKLAADVIEQLKAEKPDYNWTDLKRRLTKHGFKHADLYYGANWDNPQPAVAAEADTELLTALQDKAAATGRHDDFQVINAEGTVAAEGSAEGASSEVEEEPCLVGGRTPVTARQAPGNEFSEIAAEMDSNKSVHSDATATLA